MEVDVIVVGAGPAGLGVGVLLKKLNINFIILEK
ncbi:MAG: NAD(P)-binding domain-containing protein, partial [Bacteroidota bacterium]